MAAIASTAFDPAFDAPAITSGGTAANAGGDTFTNKLGTRVYLNNGSGAPINVTFFKGPATVRPMGGLYGDVVNSNMVVAVPAGGIVEVACPPGRFNPDGDPEGAVSMTYSAVTSLTVLVLAPSR